MCLDFKTIFVIGAALKDCTTKLVIFLSSDVTHASEQTSWCLETCQKHRIKKVEGTVLVSA